MKISRLNVAVLVQAAGLILLLLFWNPVVRVSGVILIIVGTVVYRREKKRLKLEAASQSPPHTQ
jgi:uncharacterized membrane protein